jgi:hypothetical protein
MQQAFKEKMSSTRRLSSTSPAGKRNSKTFFAQDLKGTRTFSISGIGALDPASIFDDPELSSPLGKTSAQQSVDRQAELLYTQVIHP